MSNIKQLKAKLAKLQQQNSKKIKEAAELSRIETQLKLESNPDLIQARIKFQVAKQTTTKLGNLIEESTQIINSMPIVNAKSRENRKWSGNRKIGYGTQIDLLYNLCTGILYACKEHKEILLANSKLELELINELTAGFGMPSYYSRINNVIVDETPANYNQLMGAIAMLESKLGISVDKSQLTPEKLKDEFEKAKVIAESNYEVAMMAIEEADFEL